LRGNSLPFPASPSTVEFDFATFERLRQSDGGGLVTRKIEASSVKIEDASAELATPRAERELPKAAQLLHKLVGLSNMLGARMLSTEFRKFEFLIKDENIEALDRTLERFVGVINQAKAQVERLVLCDGDR